MQGHKDTCLNPRQSQATVTGHEDGNTMEVTWMAAQVLMYEDYWKNSIRKVRNPAEVPTLWKKCASPKAYKGNYQWHNV